MPRVVPVEPAHVCGHSTSHLRATGLAPDDLRHRLPWARRDLGALRGRLATVAARRGVPAHRVALAWATCRPGTYAIVGARTPAEAADLQPLSDLTAADLADLEH